LNLRPLEISLYKKLPEVLQTQLKKSGVVPVIDKLKPLWELPDDTDIVVIMGPRGGAKTHTVSDFSTLQSSVNRKRFVIVRDEKELIRESILNEIFLRFDEWDNNGIIDNDVEKLDSGIKNKITNEMLLYTKGFRASSTTKGANLKGPSNIDYAVIEEAEDIRSVDKFNAFADGIRKKGAIIIIVLNVPDLQHWVVRRYFTPISTEYDGYFRLEPKKIKGFVCIQSDYTDNPYIPANVVQRYKGYGNPDSHLYNLHYYLTSIVGLASSGKKGQVFKKVKSITLEEYLSVQSKEYYGQDFGTSSPAGFIGLKKHRNNVYIREMNYKPKNTLQLGMMYCELGLNHTKDKIIGDNAGKDDIIKLSSGWERSELDAETIKRYSGLLKGWDIEKCIKKSLETDIRNLDSMNIFIVENTPGFWDPERGEIMNYVYAFDKNGYPLDEPIDDFNHLWDPVRYVLNYLDNVSGGTMSRSN
jgi:PBSX family phage terminase large subunit